MYVTLWRSSQAFGRVRSCDIKKPVSHIGQSSFWVRWQWGGRVKEDTEDFSSRLFCTEKYLKTQQT